MSRTRTAGLLVAALLALATTTVTTASMAPAASTIAPDGRGGVHSNPVEDPYYPAKSNPSFDTLRTHLDLTWNGTVLAGTARIAFRPTVTTGSLRLDLLQSLLVSRVTLDGAPVSFTQPRDGLLMDVGHVVADSQHTLVVEYAGTPHTVPAPSRRQDETSGLGWQRDKDGNVFTFQEPYGAYTWYPVNDEPSDRFMYSASVTVPKGQTAVSNGVLVSRRPATNGGTTFDWRLDHSVASYLTTMAIGPYTEHEATLPGGTPATYWLLPRDEADLSRLESQSEDAFGWLVQHAGPYPFDSFGTVVVGGASAMETETMVTMSRKALDRPDAVVEHEMAHQWYGDAISPRSWLDVWLNEGWAMWMQQAYETYRGGYRYLGGMHQWGPYDSASRRKDGPPGHYDRDDFGQLNIYLGPAMMLDLIRRAVGTPKFTALSEDWVTQHEFANVGRDEFISFVNAETGKDFTALIDTWLDARHTPRWP